MNQTSQLCHFWSLQSQENVHLLIPKAQSPHPREKLFCCWVLLIPHGSGQDHPFGLLVFPGFVLVGCFFESLKEHSN